MLLLALVGGWLVLRPGPTPTPADDSAEVGFARDMMDHHAQAVEMAFIIRDQSADPEIRTIGYDIITTQQAQIGMMYSWLIQWGRPIARSGQHMAWMGIAVPAPGQMPGMASAADLTKLRQLKGTEADKLFLQLMISHHQGGVAMANAAVARTTQPFVRQLAQGIITQQQAEITAMTAMLKQKGATPPATPTIDGMPMPTP